MKAVLHAAAEIVSLALFSGTTLILIILFIL